MTKLKENFNLLFGMNANAIFYSEIYEQGNEHKNKNKKSIN